MYGHTGVVQQLLSEEMQLKEVTSADRKDASGQAALHYAARWGYPEVAFCHTTKTVAEMASNCGLCS